jgi:two-component system, NtrC family, response regulator AtoC
LVLECGTRRKISFEPYGPGTYNPYLGTYVLTLESVLPLMPGTQRIPLYNEGMLLNQKVRVLVIDEDASFTRFVSTYLQRKGFEASVASALEESLRVFRVFDPALVLVDPVFSGVGSLEVLDRLRQLKQDVAAIIISAQSDPEFVFKVSKAGADDYLPKPLDLKELDQRISRILASQRLSSEVTQLRDQVRRNSDFAMLFGTSPKMEEIKNTIEQVAETTATVLIRGESGTGKEVVARMVYAQSARREKPFIKVNCAAIPHELLESELFGYEPGAFTGANRQKLGKFDLANNGTLFLDEVSEMHPALQAKLLHVLQDGEFSRLGAKRDISVDVRILAATNKQLERAVEDGTFREDLFYRLNVITIHIPPLRERREEVPVFVDYFLRKYSEFYGKQPRPFTDFAVGRMMEYSWPGNIRELENLVKRYVIVGNEPQIIRELTSHKTIISQSADEAYTSQASTAHSNSVPRVVQPAAAAIPINSGKPSDSEADSPSLLEIGRRAAMQAERAAIEKTLAQTRWNRRQAAKILKISYKALLNKLKTYEEHDAAHQKNLSA